MGVREAVRINRLPGRAHQDSRQVDEPVRSDVVLGVPGCLDICPGVLLARAPLADPSPDHGRGHNDAGRSQRRLPSRWRDYIVAGHGPGAVNTAPTARLISGASPEPERGPGCRGGAPAPEVSAHPPADRYGVPAARWARAWVGGSGGSGAPAAQTPSCSTASCAALSSGQGDPDGGQVRLPLRRAGGKRGPGIGHGPLGGQSAAVVGGGGGQLGGVRRPGVALAVQPGRQPGAQPARSRTASTVHPARGGSA